MHPASRDSILKLIDSGKAGDLLDLLLGDSSLRVSAAPSFLGDDEKYSYLMTVEHLRFVSKYGSGKSPIKEGGKIYFAHPDYFAQWLDFGAPGIAQEDLDNYFKNVQS